MGDRGPKPDPLQKAKGYPGRRKSKAEAAAARAAKVAKLMAPTGERGSSLELPAMLRDRKYVAAAAVYRRLAPELRSTHRLPKEAEFFFVQLCIYAQEWVDATDDLHTNGFDQEIETVVGGKMERRRPKAIERQQAYTNCLELSARFGLTPTDMYALFKGQAAVAPLNPGLFGDPPPPNPPSASGEPPAPEAEASRIGSMGRQRSDPPPRVN